jgi:hypothetical protein
MECYDILVHLRVLALGVILDSAMTLLSLLAVVARSRPRILYTILTQEV